MIESTKALILSHLKYSDNSLIIKCFTDSFGFKTFILKGAFSKGKKKNNKVFLLNEIEISFYKKLNNNSSTLELIKDMHQGYVFQSLHTNVVKSSMITFIGEILNQVLKNEDAYNLSLYFFLKNKLIELDNRKASFADFHLYFLLELTKYLGITPLAVNSNFPYFNLREGIFSLKSHNLSKSENGNLWNQLLTYDFNNEINCFNSSQRKMMIEEIISYYEFHIDNFKKPISLEILKEIFN